MSNMSGMDPGAVDSIAAGLSLRAQALATVVQTVDAVIAGLGATWFGEDLAAFSSSWLQVHRPRAQAVAANLGEMATQLRKQVTDQRVASGFGAAPYSGSLGRLISAGGMVAGSVVPTIRSMIGGLDRLVGTGIDRLNEPSTTLGGADPWTLGTDVIGAGELAWRKIPGVDVAIDAATGMNAVDDALHGHANWYGLADSAETGAGYFAHSGPTMLGVFAAHILTYDFEKASETDWSASSAKMAGAYILSNPLDSLQCVGEAEVTVGTKLFGWMPKP